MWKQITDEYDPRRCQGVSPTIGQCRNLAVEGSNYCLAHGGNKGVASTKKQAMNNFKLNQYKQRAEDLSGSDKLASLSDEVALLRILIEERWNRCTTSSELLLSSGPLSDLITKSASLVERCHKLDTTLGNLLDKSKVMQFAQMIIEIISKNVTDEEVLEAISREINDAFELL